jgi:hypothetical protein
MQGKKGFPTLFLSLFCKSLLNPSTMYCKVLLFYIPLHPKSIINGCYNPDINDKTTNIDDKNNYQLITFNLQAYERGQCKIADAEGNVGVLHYAFAQ